MPYESRKAVADILPRDVSGKCLKASDHATTDEAVAAFIRSLVTLDVDICLLPIDAGDPSNVQILRDVVRSANLNHKGGDGPKLKIAQAAYWLLYSNAVLAVWKHSALRRREYPNPIGFVFDREGLQESLRAKMTARIRSAFFEKLGVTVGAISWRSEEDEPLLHAPDLIAGAAHRQAKSRDCPKSFAALTGSPIGGQITILREIEILTLPSPEELERRGA